TLGPSVTVAIGGSIAVVGAIVFGLKLPALRPAAREMIVAQQMAGGAPAQEMTGRVFAKSE
ncbi:MAG TPA: MFS transporter, partial [Candidatus Angelobacter sp.]|nr:MFS transporter [Candidatus Angelobacter sp.]